ncbi:MAG TPA: ABC transporter substrate-binding protein, partial [Gaiellaceae bacterium]
PASAHHSLEVYVSQLRKLLANGDQPLSTRPRGYVLNVDADELDLVRFERVTEEGRRALREGNPALASDRLREGLELWRGPPLADLAFESSAAFEVARLEELRLAALEDRIEADLALGRHHGLVGELDRLVGEQPLRERLQGQLMLALYRCGRQAEALDVYRETRRRLVEELGIEPGPELQRLEKAILEQDPALEAPPQAMPPFRRRNLLPVVVAAALLVAALALGGYFLFGRGEHGLAKIDANAVGLVDPSSGTIRAEVALDDRTTSATAGFGSVWLTHFSENRVSRIDLRTRTVRQTLEVGRGPTGVAVGGGSVWVAALDGTVSWIDPAANTVVKTIRVGNGASGVAFGLGAVWVANTSDDTLSRIDPRQGRVTAVIPAGGDPTGVAVADGALWTTNRVDATVSRIDPRTRAVVDTVHVGNGPDAIVASAGAIWVANSRDGTVSRIDPRTNAVTATTRVGDTPAGLSVAGDAMWVVSEFYGTLSRLDPSTGVVVATHRLGDVVTAVAATRDAVWVAAGPEAKTHRGGTAFTEVPVEGPTLDLDNAFAYDTVTWSIVTSTGDGLTGFKRAGGSTQLVPDLATTLPAPADGGKRYTFTLRKGIRYSTGKPVRASDFRRAIERDFRLGSPGAFHYTKIVGASNCVKRPRRCDLSRGIVVDDAARTITFRLEARDPEFLYKLTFNFAYPVPPGTPDPRKLPNDTLSQRPTPGTGPYLVAGVGRNELRLVRNPFFHEWSKAAQPDGYPNEIVMRLRRTLDDAAAIRAVDRGELDWISWAGPSTISDLLLHHRSRLRVNPYQATVYMALNTHVPPFDDIRVRRALNYAVDRRALVERLGGSVVATPTCQVLPPGFPGYHPYCPYRGADLAKAQRLVDASGTRGMKVTVWSLAEVGPQTGRYFVSLLRSLGYRARLKQLGFGTYFDTIRDSRNNVQIALDFWVADYPAASNFISTLLSCGSFERASPANLNTAGFCNRRIDAQIRRALELQGTDQRAANALWARIDRQITDQAPWVATNNRNFVALLSKRAGNYQFSPQLGMLIDQLWVR